MIDPKSSFPVFIVKDRGAAKSFYTENLGFNVVEWICLKTESLPVSK